MNDAETRVRELEEKSVLQLSRMDELTAEASLLTEELTLTRKET